MNFRLLRLSPIIAGVSVGVLLTLLEYATVHVPGFDFLKRLEWTTFDWRVRQAQRFPQPASEKLGVVYVDDQTLADVEKNLGVQWPFPRWVHGAVLKELTDERVAGAAYDIFFLVRRDNELAPPLKPGKTVSSDAYFAQEIARNGKVILGAPSDPLPAGTRLRMPDPLFADAAAGIGHALRLADDDGVIRRVKPVIAGQNHTLTWQLGLQLAARHLGLDLNKAEMDSWQIRASDRNGRIHEIPLDGEGNLIIRWVLDINRPRALESASYSNLLGAANHRGKHGSLPTERWKDRLVVIGSTGTNPPIVDWGATPIGPSTPFLSVHWNIANSVLTGGFVRTTSLPARMSIIWLLVPAVGLLSWKLRAVWATIAVGVLIAAYLGVAFWSYVRWGWWLPVAVPVLGSVCATHAVMVVYRYFFERSYRRRVGGIFKDKLAPDVLELLLQQPHIYWEPQEKNMTVLFADIRGFTALTAGTAGDAPPGGESGDKQALETVNLYLSTVVETLKRHGATLDKYMGDAVMLFWGAPLDHPGHAASAVRAACEAQSLIRRMNEQRELENTGIRKLNQENAQRGLPPRPLLPTLQLGTGISTGTMTVGFMGSSAYPSNYTVFGHAVNIAARLQSAAGSGRIYMTGDTRQAAVLAAPELALRMKPVGDLALKGIPDPVPAFEIDWPDDRNSGG